MDERNASKAGGPLIIIREANNSLSLIPYAERASNLVNEATAINRII